MSYDHEVLEQRGDYRARIVHDVFAGEPYDDGATPIVMTHHGVRGWEAGQVGGTSYEVDEAILTAARRFAGDPDLLERYLRIFHDVTSIKWYESREGETFLSYVTPDWLEHVGHERDDTTVQADLTEWTAYCEGDTWGVVIEERTTWQRTDVPTFGEPIVRYEWEEIDSCWGFYGREWAEQSAREQLDIHAPAEEVSA